MADLKISQLTAISVLTPATDVLPVVDVGGVTKKINTNQILGSGGTATLASATISGDLTVKTNVLKVDTTNNRVGIGTATPAKRCEINQSANAFSTIGDGEIIRLIGDDGNTIGRITELGFGTGPSGGTFAPVIIGAINTNVTSFGRKDLYFATRPTSADTAPVERYRLASDGVATWSNVGGVAGTAMTLNSTGLGIGISPVYKFHAAVTSGAVGAFRATTAAIARLLVGNTVEDVELKVNANGDGQLTANASKYLGLGSGGLNDRVILDTSGNLLVGKTSGVNKIETVGAGVDGRGTVTGVSTVATTIYTIKQSATAAMCVVFGDDGTNGFCDIVLFLATVAPKVVSSQTLYGSPAARTYSASTTNLQLALASGTLSIRTAALSTLNT